MALICTVRRNGIALDLYGEERRRWKNDVDLQVKKQLQEMVLICMMIKKWHGKNGVDLYKEKRAVEVNEFTNVNTFSELVKY